MSDLTSPSVRIGVFGHDGSGERERHGCKLWGAGAAACLVAAGAEPVVIPDQASADWDDLLEGLDGVVVTGHDTASRRQAVEGEALVQWCRKRRVPLLGIDHGLLLLNTANGGTLYQDLPRELPEALQHRHPPERGLRHAINILPDTRMAALYGEGEVVVNSEHRRGIQKLARGFRVGARALDGVIEAVEFTGDWYAVGVQWQPASATASGLDIQLFRGLVEACQGAATAEAPKVLTKAA